MNENDIELKHNISKENLEFNLPEFYKLVNKAILNKNVQSLYDLSKIFNRKYLKDSDL